MLGAQLEVADNRKVQRKSFRVALDALFCIEGITFNCAIGACARAKRPWHQREGGGLPRSSTFKIDS